MTDDEISAEALRIAEAAGLPLSQGMALYGAIAAFGRMVRDRCALVPAPVVPVVTKVTKERRRPVWTDAMREAARKRAAENGLHEKGAAALSAYHARARAARAARNAAWTAARDARNAAS